MALKLRASALSAAGTECVSLTVESDFSIIVHYFSGKIEGKLQTYGSIHPDNEQYNNTPKRTES